MWILTPILKPEYSPDTSGSAYNYVWIYHPNMKSWT